MHSQLRLRLPLPLPIAVAVFAAVAAAMLFLLVVVRTGGDAKPRTTRTPAAARGETPRARGPMTAEPTTALARALARHGVVVVSFALPGVVLDAETLAEARAGAQAAGVGFLGLTLNSEAAARVADELGVTATPAVAVVRRGREVQTRFDGYADRETIAQAAASART